MENRSKEKDFSPSLNPIEIQTVIVFDKDDSSLFYRFIE